jgi:hypothetical protein
VGDAGDILRRIARELGGEGVVAALCRGLAPRDLQSLLLHVMAERAGRVGPLEALREYERLPAMKR